jgi:hypothetical protein
MSTTTRKQDHVVNHGALEPKIQKKKKKNFFKKTAQTTRKKHLK